MEKVNQEAKKFKSKTEKSGHAGERIVALNLKEEKYLIFDYGVRKTAVIFSFLCNEIDLEDFDIRPLLDFPLSSNGTIYFIRC